jgi:gluconokinase
LNRKDYIIAIDMGTTSAKAIIYRLGGSIEGSESLNYSTFYPGPGLVEQNPDKVLEAVVKVVHMLMEKTGINAKSVSALSFGGIWQSTLPVDAYGKSLSGAMIWADRRSLKQSERLRAELDVEEVKERTGCTIHPMYFLPRLVWFREEAPEIFKQTHKFISIKEYVLCHLFGQFVVDKSIASGTGIWRIATMDWDEELLKVVEMSPEKFSQVVEPTFMLSGLKLEYASQMSLLEGTPGVVGAADGALSHLGSVGLLDERMSLMVGTGAALRRRLTEPRVLPGVETWCYYLLENNWLIGGIVHDAGIVIKWFADNFITDDEAQGQAFKVLNEWADEIAPGADGLVFLPFLGGERCPHYNPDAGGAVLGITFSHSKKHLLRALMEGISYRLYSVYKMLAGDFEPELVVTGGIVKSAAWLRITADFFGKTLWMPKVTEASAWGGVLIGLRALGVIDKIEKINELVKVEGKQEPDLERHKLYQKIYSSYTKLYGKLF